MSLIIILFSLCLAYGIFEKYRHQKRVDSLAIRVNVNGIRGKSTVTRLITGIMSAAGLKVVGKTTGTSARMLFWFTRQETPVIRRKEGPNIGEQFKVVAQAVKLGAEALVCECMAVNPDYQIVFQEQLLQANIGVIVNVLEDHMEVMGPTLDHIADAFTTTVPYHGKLIIAPGPYADYFANIAQQRGTQIFMADTAGITDQDLKRFDYVVFPENVALALALAQALDIEKEIAWTGMLQANPDPGVLSIEEVEVLGRTTYFVNGFAANDATSTLNIWRRVQDMGYPTQDAVVLVNCRHDRVDRTIQFAEEVLPFIPAKLLVVMGTSVKPIADAFAAGKIPAREFLDLEGYPAKSVYAKIEQRIAGEVIFGIANIHGHAEEFIELLLKRSIYGNLGEDKHEETVTCTEQNYTLPL